MGKIAVRTYAEKINRKEKLIFKSKPIPLTHERILVFDTETTNDEFQNFKFGSFLISEKGKEQYRALFYHPNSVTKKEERELKNYSKKYEIDLLTLNDFIEKILYPETLHTKTLCVGFNLPFDLSRLAFNWGEGRGHHRGWFSFQLSKNKFLPRIKIKHIDSTKSFIQFAGNQNYQRKRNTFKGYFLDLKTLSVVFSDEKKINLLGAGKFFGCKILKNEAEKHGRIDEGYISYNLNDTLATHELYIKILEHYEMYGIEAPITKIYSSASLGKHALKQMGIQPLSRISTSVNSRLKGQLMAGYFGGRCELKLRKIPIEVSVLDFLSMYPSLAINMGLWEFITAKEIKQEDVTDSIVSLLRKINLIELIRRYLWKNLNILVELEPDNDVLPVRSNYLKDSQVYNVGINYFRHKNSFYYSLPDVIASVLLTGKIPKIKRAIKFTPKGKQNSLKKTKILGIEIDPSKENLIKFIIEKRQEFKQKSINACNEQERKYFDGIQKALKILANSITYGIFIEVNQQDKDSDLKVYADKEFITRQKLEEEGKFFNPLISVMQVGGARLLLAMAERFLAENEYQHIYMDTDSCFVPSNIALKLKNFFKPLNPYNFEADFFKIEKENLWFYGISSKRYVLYKKQREKIEILDYKLHGLGHLLNPYKKGIDWQKRIWQDILDLHYNNISEREIIEKYSNLYAVSKLAISTPNLLGRFKNFNKGKNISRQLKPFNFILVGQGNSEVKPVSSFNNNPQAVIHGRFIDYKSGKTMKGQKYWRPLANIIFDYANHPESKFEGKKGWLKRRKIEGGEIKLIGKETKNIEEQFLELRNPIEYSDKEELEKKILELSPREARKLGIKHRSTLKRWKDKIKKGEKIKISSKLILKMNL